VAHQIEIIGEATKNVPKSIRDRYKELPWQDMAKMRDKISHFYFGINYEIVMNTNIRTRGNPMCTIMSIKINMALMIINIPDMREKSIDTKIKRKKLNIHLSKKKVSGYY
ncbi:MAG: DUF86 domain-containing protein, partial [Nitrospirae bacterium]|nr:DUF86 domain-containing protein [Nitrospirota bacterium]